LAGSEPETDLSATSVETKAERTDPQELDFPQEADIPFEPFSEKQVIIPTDNSADDTDLTGNKAQTEPATAIPDKPSIEVIPTPVEFTVNGSGIPMWEAIPLTVEKAIGRTYSVLRGSDAHFALGFYLIVLIFALLSCCQPRKITPKSLETQYQSLTFPPAKPKSVTNSLATLEAHLAEMLQAHLECQREVVDSHTSLCEELRVIA
jgi:hypothetical protein